MLVPLLTISLHHGRPDGASSWPLAPVLVGGERRAYHSAGEGAGAASVAKCSESMAYGGYGAAAAIVKVVILCREAKAHTVLNATDAMRCSVLSAMALTLSSLAARHQTL